MVLEGPSIKDQSEYSTQAALSIAQLLKFNCVKHARKQTAFSPSVRHSSEQETPLPVYIGLMLHAKTRKGNLIDKLSNLGLCISYDRVLSLSAEMGNSVCQRHHMEQVVCPPALKQGVLTISAVDNIDHNPSATTAIDSFHGTGTSLIQYPSNTSDKEEHNPPAIVTGGNSGCKTSCTDVQPITSNVKQAAIHSSSVTSLKRNEYKLHVEVEYKWLENARCVLEENRELENVSWAAYHAENQEARDITVTPTALLPLFQESAHTVAMIRHSIDIVRNAEEHLNSGQTPVLTLDQPLLL